MKLRRLTVRELVLLIVAAPLVIAAAWVNVGPSGGFVSDVSLTPAEAYGVDVGAPADGVRLDAMATDTEGDTLLVTNQQDTTATLNGMMISLSETVSKIIFGANNRVTSDSLASDGDIFTFSDPLAVGGSGAGPALDISTSLTGAAGALIDLSNATHEADDYDIYIDGNNSWSNGVVRASTHDSLSAAWATKWSPRSTGLDFIVEILGNNAGNFIFRDKDDNTLVEFTGYSGDVTVTSGTLVVAGTASNTWTEGGVLTASIVVGNGSVRSDAYYPKTAGNDFAFFVWQDDVNYVFNNAGGGDLLTLSAASGNRDLTSGTEVFGPVVSTVSGAGASYAWSNVAVLIINSADQVDVDLPDASANDGKTVWIKRWGTGLVDIEKTGGDTIDGATSVSLAAQYDGMRLMASDTLNAWIILSESDGP